MSAKAAFDLLDQMVDREFGGVAVERPDFVAPLLVPLRDLANDMFELLFERLDVGLRLRRVWPRGQALNSSGGTTSPFAAGASAKPTGVRSSRIALRRRLFPQRGEGLELLLLERFVDRAAPRLVVLALERGGRRALADPRSACASPP